jgi:hypothetical protein
VLFCAALMAFFSVNAYAQGGATTTLAGTVVDSSGAMIPGADVVAKNNATATEYRAVTDSTGHFSITALNSGTYTVTVSLMGFKSVVLPDVAVTQGVANSIRPIALEVGQLAETITVTGATELLQTQSATVATTLNTTQVSKAPLPTRNTMDFVVMLPGVSTTTAARYSTVMGLPGSALNITIDGLNVQDQALKGTTGSSFFAFINPRLDAVEEVTVSTANPGAESAGQGAVQIRFQTRSGTNQFRGSIYEYLRKTAWNTNYWYNDHQNYPALPKDKADITTWGGRIGGPIVKDRAFFFFNYEDFKQPLGVTRTRTVLTPDSLAGTFDYTVNGVAQQVNLLTVAQSAGQTATTDPTMMSLLNGINATLAGQSITAGSNSVTNTLTFQNSGAAHRIYPTFRFDVNVTKNNRLGISGYLQKFISNPDILNSRDPVFPGYSLAGNQWGWRPSFMVDWRSVIGANLVNQARVGYMGWKPTHFYDNIQGSDFPGGLRLSMPLITVPYPTSNWEQRASPVFNIDDTLTWMKGKHTISVGGSYSQIGYTDTFQYFAPFTGIGFDQTNDPANAMFNATNFPGASTSDLNNARSLYALLTGRVTSINNTAYLNPGTGNYDYMGPWQYSVKQKEFGFFVTDSWRIRPNLTLTGGVRYELQLPFTSQNKFFAQVQDPSQLYGISGVDANGNPNYFWAPGLANTGPATTYVVPLVAGAPPFQTDKNNFAPSGGVAWKVPVKHGGWLAKILSEDPVLRGGYSRAYTREGLVTVADIYSYNPGGSIPVQRNQNLGNLTSTWPLLLSGDVSPASFPAAPVYPMPVSISSSINAFAPNTQTPWVHSFNIGFQRAISKNSVMEVRYVGTRSRGGWVDGGRSLNELNVVDNGFMTEFQHAQANLAINQQAGGQTNGNWNAAGNTFAYAGLPGQYPLPLFQAYFSGLSQTTANDNVATAYTSTQYKNTTYLGYMTPTNPAPKSMAALFWSNSTFRNNGTTAGMPANVFYMNPSVGGVYVTGRPQDQMSQNFDALQLEFRRRMSGGLLVAASYQGIIRQDRSSYVSLRTGPEMVSQSSPVHAVKVNWNYELPFGQGRRWGGGASRAWNAVIGGWSFDGTGRLQTGNRLDFGNVLLVGMTDQQLEDSIHVYTMPDATNPNITRVYILPQDIIQNTIRAYSTSATSVTGYSGTAPSGRYFAPIQSAGCLQPYNGACMVNGQIVAGPSDHHYVTGPGFMRFDMAVTKRFDVWRRVNAEFRVDVLNVLNNIDWVGNTTLGGNAITSYQLPAASGAYKDLSNTQDPGGRIIQLSWRINF